MAESAPTLSTAFRFYIQILELRNNPMSATGQGQQTHVEPRTASPGGVIEKIERNADGLLCVASEREQRVRVWRFEQILAQL